MSQAEDLTHMARALKLALCGLYTTDPNPRVGSVLVKNGAVVGEGFHVRAGEAHPAELALGIVAEVPHRRSPFSRELEGVWVRSP